MSDIDVPPASPGAASFTFATPLSPLAAAAAPSLAAGSAVGFGGSDAGFGLSFGPGLGWGRASELGFGGSAVFPSFGTVSGGDGGDDDDGGDHDGPRLTADPAARCSLLDVLKGTVSGRDRTSARRKEQRGGKRQRK
eukprot:gene45700-6571_t